MTTMADLTYTERLEVERIVDEIKQMGVGTVDVPKYSSTTGKRHPYREPVARLLGWPVEIGVDTDPQDGRRFVWFTRKEEDVAVDPETQAARERLGFAE
jgi:hypothetical protein